MCDFVSINAKNIMMEKFEDYLKNHGTDLECQLMNAYEICRRGYHVSFIPKMDEVWHEFKNTLDPEFEEYLRLREKFEVFEKDGTVTNV